MTNPAPLPIPVQRVAPMLIQRGGRQVTGQVGDAHCYAFAKADRRVTCFYFYVWDDDFGPGFIKLCTYFPYPAKVWVNGHVRHEAS